MQALLDYYVEELDCDIKIRVEFDFQPAEPEVGISEPDIDIQSVEVMQAEGWVLKPNYETHMDESSIKEECWNMLKAIEESKQLQKEMDAEYRGELSEEEKLYENR